MSDGVTRDLSAKQVAEAMGVTVRSVQGWARLDPPCPCDRGPRAGGGRNQLWFNLDEVRAWQTSVGIDSTRGALFDEKEKDAGEPTTDAKVIAAKARVANLSDAEIAAFDTLSAAKRNIILLIEQLSASTLATAPETVSKLTKAIADLNKEQRLNEEREHEREERLRQLIRRSLATQKDERAATFYRTGVQRLMLDVPGWTFAALMEAGVTCTVEQQEAAERLMNVRLREGVDGFLATMASQLDRASREIGIEAPKLGPGSEAA